MKDQRGRRPGRLKFFAEEWPKQCPNCGRPTVPPARAGLKIEVDPKLHAVTAETADGTCCRCKSGTRSKKAAGVDYYGRALPAKVTERPDRKHTRKGGISDAEIEASREALRNLILGRRLRGIPPEGLDPEEIGNGGLYSSQVP